jgi:hypothetical protein
VRISVEGNADVEIIYVDDGSDDVLVEGTIGTLEVAGSDVTVTATGATLTSGIVSGDNSRIVLGAGSTLKEGAINGNASVITVNAGATVDKITVSAAGAKVEGTGTVKTVVLTSDAKDVVVTTPGTKIEEEQGEAPGTGGGGGGSTSPSTLELDIVSVKYNGSPVERDGEIYLIPTDSLDKNLAEIIVTITNTPAVSYTVELTIKNNESVVAYGKSTGIQKRHLDLLNNEPVSFGDIGLMFDHIGDVAAESYYYKDATNKQMAGDNPNQNFFEDSIDAMVRRMGVGDIYTVTLKLTPADGSAVEKTISVALDNE